MKFWQAIDKLTTVAAAIWVEAQMLSDQVKTTQPSQWLQRQTPASSPVTRRVELGKTLQENSHVLSEITQQDADVPKDELQDASQDSSRASEESMRRVKVSVTVHSQQVTEEHAVHMDAESTLTRVVKTTTTDVETGVDAPADTDVTVEVALDGKVSVSTRRRSVPKEPIKIWGTLAYDGIKGTKYIAAATYSQELIPKRVMEQAEMQADLRASNEDYGTYELEEVPVTVNMRRQYARLCTICKTNNIPYNEALKPITAYDYRLAAMSLVKLLRRHGVVVYR